MGPTPGSWSQNLLGWGLGTFLLNRYCKHRNCSWRTTARSPVNSLALSGPHPSCLLSRGERGLFRGPRCSTSPGTSMSICDSHLVSQLQEEQTIKPHMTAPPSRSTLRGCARRLQGAPPVLGLLASCPHHPAAPPQGPWPQPSGTASASPPSFDLAVTRGAPAYHPPPVFPPVRVLKCWARLPSRSLGHRAISPKPRDPQEISVG